MDLPQLKNEAQLAQKQSKQNNDDCAPRIIPLFKIKNVQTQACSLTKLLAMVTSSYLTPSAIKNDGASAQIPYSLAQTSSSLTDFKDGTPELRLPSNTFSLSFQSRSMSRGDDFTEAAPLDAAPSFDDVLLAIAASFIAGVMTFLP
mmetsp:Transcript_7117/g.10378  ORF Transcript_7117/g.10378 Transcript_7117/m.10378 type:complete len:146 (-) Transcript_7117:1778-2215(-)